MHRIYRQQNYFCGKLANFAALLFIQSMIIEKPVLGIKRKNLFSPNHIGNDEAIFSLVAAQLQLLGCMVEICGEDDVQENTKIPQQHIFNMSRSKPLVKQLQEWERSGKMIVNSAFGIENCFRTNMTNILIKGGVLYPKSFVVDTSADIGLVYEQLPGKGVWLKRGDFHAIHKEDVTFAASKEEAQHILKEYSLRGIQEAVISEHLVGDLVKFYGVAGGDFFYFFYPYDHNHHKYDVYATINGNTLHYPFDQSRLKQEAIKAAALLNVEIYGGDAIVTQNGDIFIIDLNDWPSFAPCREQGAKAIARYLFEKFSQD